MTMNHCLQGDALEQLGTLPAECVQTCVTSPPYWGLRDYGVPGQLGREPTPDEYVAKLVAVFAEVRRVLRGDGTLWMNIGDCFSSGGRGSSDSHRQVIGESTASAQCLGAKKAPAGFKPKDLIGIPWRVAFALQADGWYLRSDIIWSKPNPIPESVTDRPTRAHEYLFLLSKSARYFYDADAIAEAQRRDWSSERRGAKYMSAVQGRKDGGKPEGLGNGETRNRRSVWTVAPEPYAEAHFACFPRKLVEPCILAGSHNGDVVLDPFMGSGTTAQVAMSLGRKWLGVELNPEYIEMQNRRARQFGMALERMELLMARSGRPPRGSF